MTIVCGILITICLSYMIVGILANQSANFGDSKGEMKDFSKDGVEILEKKDKMARKTRLKDIL